MERDYAKPLMVIERFTSQEYVAQCTEWVVVKPIGDIRSYSRIDFNGNGKFDYESSYVNEYTERGWDYFGNDQSGAILGGTNEIVDVNVYKIDPSKSNITPSGENGHGYDNGDYTKIASRLLKHTFKGNVKYYAIELSGSTYTEVNAS